jgi:hypothetical protein
VEALNTTTIRRLIPSARHQLPAITRRPAGCLSPPRLWCKPTSWPTGVWYPTGGSHHSLLVEMSDYLLVIEGPQDDARTAVVIAEVKNLAPNKPIFFAARQQGARWPLHTDSEQLSV